MPDPNFETVSASQSAGLFDRSPYVTRRSLFDFLHDHIDIDEKENDSMRWGKAVQPFILRRAADKLNLDVIANEADEYVRHKELPIGCTRDAHLTCPTRGFGVIEAKAVRYMVFRDDWTATAAPIHIEVQLQHQMQTMGAEWGAIAVMVGANEDFQIYERRPNPQLFDQIAKESRALMADVANHRRPPVFGDSVELKGLEHLYPEIVPTKKHEDMADMQLAQWLAEYAQASEAESFNAKWREQLKAKILDRAKDAGIIRVYRALAKVARSAVPESSVMLPGDIRSGLMNFMKLAEVSVNAGAFEAEALAPVLAAINWKKVTKAAHKRTAISVETISTDPPPPAEEIGWQIEGG